MERRQPWASATVEHGRDARHRSVRPCLGTGSGPCPTGELVPKGRCRACSTTTTQRGYGAEWQRYSKAKRAAQPWCSTCGPGCQCVSCKRADWTVDHTTDAVYCRSCHRSEAQGGVRRNLGA